MLASAAAAAFLASCGGPETERPHTKTVTSVIATDALPSGSSTPTSGSSAATSSEAAPPAHPPGEGADIGEVAAWIQAGQAADPKTYHTVQDDRDTPPRVVNIGEGVAFVSPSKKISCVGGRSDGDFGQLSEPLACLVDLQNPPPRPSGVGQWVGGWVDYTGAAASVGSFHGDPGALGDGNGKVLAYGQRLTFANGSDQFTCRMDQNGLWCLDSSKRSAVLISDRGVTPYGCLHEAGHREDLGVSYTC